MHYIVGLGNPGEEYAQTRHNAGEMILRFFIEDAGLPALHDSSAHSGAWSEGTLHGSDVACLFPHTFMNHSGAAVAKMVPAEAISRLLVIYDDVDLPIGTMKASFDRGAGGHNGIRSIAESLGSQAFARLRIGVAKRQLLTGRATRPSAAALADYVLGTFTKKELEALGEMRMRTYEAICSFIDEGPERMMNRFN